MAKPGGSQAQALRRPLPGLPGTHWILSATVCDASCEMLPAREAHMSLGVQGLHCVTDTGYPGRKLTALRAVGTNPAARPVQCDSRAQRPSYQRQRSMNWDPRTHPSASPESSPSLGLCRV